MNRTKKAKIYLGVDGGQSHTEALVADEFGNIIGRGLGGATDHAESVKGKLRLQTAVFTSVSEALKDAGLGNLSENIFDFAHFGMTGGADFKEPIIKEIIHANHLCIGHDAPTALASGTLGKPGIVVISGTGSVAYGENEKGETAQAGGLGYLFSDEGSGFWLGVQTIRLAIKEQDGIIPDVGLQTLVLHHFGAKKIREVTTAFYNDKISRKDIAGLSPIVQAAAINGNEVLRKEIQYGVSCVIDNVKSVFRQLKFVENIDIVGVGGMFKGEIFTKFFKEILLEKLPQTRFIKPSLGPAIGALLLAYRNAKIELSEQLLSNLEKTQFGRQ